MSASPWTKFYWSDWLAGTSGLTAAERGVYITMLALIYENGAPVPFDAGRLARRCGIPAGSFMRIFDALLDDGKLTLTEDGCVTNRRAEKELGEREIERTGRQSGAHKTNAIKSQKAQQNQCDDERLANASRARVPEARSQIPEEVRERPNGLLSETSSDQRPKRAPKGKGNGKGKIEYPEAFERLWAAYPSRPNQSKAKALEAWKKFDKERRDGAVIAAPLFAEQCRKAGTDPQFIPHCATWLNERRFDEFVEYEDDGEAEGQRGDGGIRTAADRPADEENIHQDGSGMDPRQRRLVSGSGQHGPRGQAVHAPMAGLLDAHRLQAEGLAREAAQGCDPWRQRPHDMDGAGAFPECSDGAAGGRSSHSPRFH